MLDLGFGKSLSSILNGFLKKTALVFASRHQSGGFFSVKLIGIIGTQVESIGRTQRR